MNLKRESDIEQLRRIAVAQQTQIEQLLRIVASQAAELGALKGHDGELQEKLALLEELSRKAQTTTQDETAPDPSPSPKGKPPTHRSHRGNTEQPSLPVVEQTFELDPMFLRVPKCAAERAPSPVTSRGGTVLGDHEVRGDEGEAGDDAGEGGEWATRASDAGA